MDCLSVYLVEYTGEKPVTEEDFDSSGNDTSQVEARFTSLFCGSGEFHNENLWAEASIAFSSKSQYSIAFSASTPSLNKIPLSRGYAAIDDVKFADGACPSKFKWHSYYYHQ